MHAVSDSTLTVASFSETGASYVAVELETMNFRVIFVMTGLGCKHRHETCFDCPYCIFFFNINLN